jgi:type I restriction enzyme M protein
MAEPNRAPSSWSVADRLRGDHGRSEHGRLVVSSTVPRPLGGPPLRRSAENQAFGYRASTAERPARDAGETTALGTQANAPANPLVAAELRDTEDVPLVEDGHANFEREAPPRASDAWIDEEKTAVGYEIPFDRHFCVLESPRPLAEVDAELDGVVDRVAGPSGVLSR